MKKTVTMLAAAAAVVLSVSSSAQSFASDRGRELLVQAQSSYANRENSAEVERTLSLLADAEKNATDENGCRENGRLRKRHGEGEGRLRSR
jgi:hypothetical protein